MPRFLVGLHCPVTSLLFLYFVLLAFYVNFGIAGNWPYDDFESKHDNPAAEQIVFFGDSDIEKWDLEESFPGLGALNCGVGGCTAEHIQKAGERFLQKYRPKV